VATDKYYAGLFEYGNTNALELIHTDEGWLMFQGQSFHMNTILKIIWQCQSGS
jgi:hypothetical protein